jgi:GT2 family glycosyltransferase
MVTVGIVTRDSSSHLPPLFRSLIENGVAPSQICVFDNSSSDDSAGFAHSMGATVLRSPQNRGFAYGCNRLLAHASRHRPLLLLNPDIVITRGSIARLLRTAEESPRAAIVAPRLLNRDGSLQYSARRFPTALSWLLRFPPLRHRTLRSGAVQRYLEGASPDGVAQEVDWVMGAAMLCQTELVLQAGGFDERFFLYVEDLELCLRLHRLGQSVVYEPRAVMIHRHGQASGKSIFRRAFWVHAQSIALFYRKHPDLLLHPRAWR